MKKKTFRVSTTVGRNDDLLALLGLHAGEELLDVLLTHDLLVLHELLQVQLEVLLHVVILLDGVELLDVAERGQGLHALLVAGLVLPRLAGLLVRLHAVQGIEEEAQRFFLVDLRDK